MENWKITGLVAGIIIILLIPYAGIRYNKQKAGQYLESSATHVGATQCIECHQKEHDLWEVSHHAKAMAIATEESVLGNFNDQEFISKGVRHKFYKKDGDFFVFTSGAGGKMTEYKISHTFGYTPLQQYLIPFEKGKYQCLPIAWNTEKNEWFDMAAMVYEGENIKPHDWLYWTNQAQNWNGMCAECHSTNLKKNYFPLTDSFNTTWSEINVSCEACHGPGSKHLEWAEWPAMKQQKDPDCGLVVQTSNINNEQYVNLCARCHSRRSQLGDFQHGKKNLLDDIVPALIHADYYADGQILNEDYVFGSFVQSKMYHNDIKCNDCHDVHSGNRLFEKNDLCLQCHQENYYGTARHHFHKLEGEKGNPLLINGKEVAVGEGSLCVNCHMPGRYYMGIDFRNDHSIRIPRPDLTEKIGVPNACTQCHTDKNSKWAIAYYEEWYGKKERPHYGTTLFAARAGKAESVSELIQLVNNELTPLILRATALELLASFQSDEIPQLVLHMLKASESLLRLSAIKVYQNSNSDEFLRDLSPLLADPVKAVRMEAAIKLSVVPENYHLEKYRKAYKNAIREYRLQNEYMADFPMGSANLGLLYTNQNNIEKAIYFYKKSLDTDSAFIPASFNLALAYNRNGENDKAEKIYRDLIAINTEYNEVYYSLGLLLAETERYVEATKYLRLASEKSPDNARINYNLGLLYAQIGNIESAEKQINLALIKEPENVDFAYALAFQYVNHQKLQEAEQLLTQWLHRYPENANLNQIYRHLKSLEK